MADDVGQDLPVKGSTYRIPKMDDVADAVVAFTDYSESIPYSEYIETVTLSSDTRETLTVNVTDDYNGKMIVAQTDAILEFGNLENGFSVACVAENGSTITYFGVDKNGQKSTQYQVATVVTVNDLNILSLASPYDGEVGGEGGGGSIALGTPPAPVLVDEEGNPDSSGGNVIYFIPGTPDENQKEAIFYVAKIRKQNGSPLTTETVTIDQEHMKIFLAGTETSVAYIVDVYGVNENGKGETVSTSNFEINVVLPGLLHTGTKEFQVPEWVDSMFYEIVKKSDSSRVQLVTSADPFKITAQGEFVLRSAESEGQPWLTEQEFGSKDWKYENYTYGGSNCHCVAINPCDCCWGDCGGSCPPLEWGSTTCYNCCGSQCGPCTGQRPVNYPAPWQYGPGSNTYPYSGEGHWFYIYERVDA